MQKIYLKYPEISEIKANITSRKQSEDTTQIILDRTIFMPKSNYLLEDRGEISGMKIISIDEKRDNIIHLVEGRPQKSEVVLKLNMDIRYRNLVYNTVYVLFKILFQNIYNIKDINLKLSEDSSQLVLSNFNDIIDKDLIENQMNFLIQKSIHIHNENGISSVNPLAEVINNDICFDNTSKVQGFKILNIKTFDDDLLIDFIAGNDILYK